MAVRPHRCQYLPTPLFSHRNGSRAIVRVLTWNVEGAFPYKAEDEIAAQIEYLKELDSLPDLLLLNEVNQYRRAFIRDLLAAELGYDGIVDTLSMRVLETVDSTTSLHLKS